MVQRIPIPMNREAKEQIIAEWPQLADWLDRLDGDNVGEFIVWLEKQSVYDQTKALATLVSRDKLMPFAREWAPDWFMAWVEANKERLF